VASRSDPDGGLAPIVNRRVVGVRSGVVNGSSALHWRGWAHRTSENAVAAMIAELAFFYEVGWVNKGQEEEGLGCSAPAPSAG
jgi:hypothetical protein